MIGTLGGPELILILVIALIVFGPRKLPEMGKSIGRMMVEFRKASTEFRRTVEQEVEAEARPAAQIAPAAASTAAEPRDLETSQASPSPRPPDEGRTAAREAAEASEPAEPTGTPAADAPQPETR